jgi:hypothetical protein
MRTCFLEMVAIIFQAIFLTLLTLITISQLISLLKGGLE